MSDDDYSYDYSDEEDYDIEEDDDEMDWNPSATGGIASENPNAAPTISAGVQKCIRISPAEDLIPDMERLLKDVTEILDIPAAAAAVLLREHNWSKEQLCEVFYADSEKILKKCGVFYRCNPKMATSDNDEDCCPICYDDMPADKKMAMPCGHEFCMDCWHDFCANAVEQEGPSCVYTTCPEATCTEVVTGVEVEKAAPDYFQKFQTFQLRNFVESNALSRWCPGVGCERIACAATASAMEQEGCIAHCDGCSTSFCMVCGEEPHAPSGCKELALWNEKCRNESETANWILANTKSCPKCASRIEKNQGCNHITCQRCKHEFCWICSGDWASHGANTGGYYKCNKYDPNNSNSDDTSDAAQAKRELDRYLHYYKRYHAHSEAQKFAKKQLKETESRMIALQESSDNAKWTDVEFLKTANEQLVECRKVLKYTYVYAYYMNPNDKMEKERFEHHQEMLEKFTENLSEQSESPLDKMDRTDVVNQTRVVDRFMKNVLKYVEEGMDG
jgi:ariadne-1